MYRAMMGYPVVWVRAVPVPAIVGITAVLAVPVPAIVGITAEMAVFDPLQWGLLQKWLYLTRYSGIYCRISGFRTLHDETKGL